MKYTYGFLGLFALVLLAVVPYGWVADQIPLLDALLGSLFGSELAHTVGHVLIFFAIGSAGLLVWPELRRRPLRYFALILLVACLQEGFQLLYKDRGIILNDITDILTDLVAAGLAFALAQKVDRRVDPIVMGLPKR